MPSLKANWQLMILKKLEVEKSKFDTEVKQRIKELEFQQATIRLKKGKT